MTNAELIKALRCCSSPDTTCKVQCPYQTIHETNGMCIDSMIIDAAAALEAAEKRIAELEAQEPTEKQVVDYCHKRCFVIVEGELFQRMKATYAQIPKRGEWIGVNPMVDTEQCSLCGWNIPTYEFETNYCPNCGAYMRGEQDE